MAAKIFEVGDVLPATTQLRISWTITATNVPNFTYEDSSYRIDCLTGSFGSYGSALIYIYVEDDFSKPFWMKINGVYIYDSPSWKSPYTDADGDHAYIDIDTSNWSESERTISNIQDSSIEGFFYWEDLAPAPSGYTITFNSNGGTTISDIEEATELPTLPIPIKSGYTFVAWYYESNFQTRAKAGDTIESNVTLYAKWHNLGSLFTEIANAIREKESSSGTIRDVDFGERIKQIQPAKEEETKTLEPDFSGGNQVITPTSGKVMTSVTLTKPTDLIPENIAKDKNVCGVVGTSFIAIELTQTEYDTLSTKDSNTYYLIVEE